MTSANRVTRREFVHGSAVVAAGAALGLSAPYHVRAGNPDKSDTSKILNYNPDMEYRRCGRTNWMISAVCMGGHWKRIDTVVSRVRKGSGWIDIGQGNPSSRRTATRSSPAASIGASTTSTPASAPRSWPTAKP